MGCCICCVRKQKHWVRSGGHAFRGGSVRLTSRLLQKRLEYKEVYTGFIFYKPVGEWVFGIGIPNMADAGFADELVRRDSEIWSGETMSSPEERSEIYDYYARTRSFRIPDLSGQTSFIEKIDRQISRYYKPGVRKGETE